MAMENKKGEEIRKILLRILGSPPLSFIERIRQSLVNGTERMNDKNS